MNKLTFSFDLGYASIGWSALQGDPQVEVLGTGVVLFPKDDCLASHRRAYRRQRRTIRSRRQRIDRIGRILEHHGIITPEQRLQPGHPAPFWLAARALTGKIRLSGMEVWHLMRWYAHNRGYDGNSLWAGARAAVEEDEEDTKKVEAAKDKMKQTGSSTMAETVVKLLGLSLDGNQSSMKAYKTLDMAFPREVVKREVARLMEKSEVPQHVVDLILDDVHEHREELAACGVRFPRRFAGSVLFGQLVPRFDNRIIARCPITWAREYIQAKEEGADEKAAKARADKYAKVPNAHCKEFYEYRFARILCNIRVEGKPLGADMRRRLMDLAREQGKFTATSFKKAVKELIGDAKSNLYNFFQIHPDSDKALIVVPSSEKERASGRAPYARPVLRQVVEEVLRGEDPTRAAMSLTHPDGEAKAQDGVLYSLLDPESEVSRIQAKRRVEDMSNNHLVRHRMLIFKRLLRDMVKKYAGGDPDTVGQICIEVGRELSEFSGKTAKEIAAELGNRMKHFHSAVKRLEQDAPDLPLNAGLIRKCRIAMDLGWTCPFTGQKYGAYDLPKLEREHVIPHANRNSNALASLVLTWPEVNRMKGKRTGLQFVKEEGGHEVPGRPNISIVTEAWYKKFVEKLDTKGAPDDYKRKKRRKQMMLVDTLSAKTTKEEGLGFTDGMMTQSSQLMKIAGHVAKGVCPNVRIVMIPGAVTAAVRASWNAWGLLAQVCPDVVDPETGTLRDKEAIRGITHLHHAVDACMLGLILLLIPAGANGVVWQALAMRRLPAEQVQKLRELIAKSCLRIDNENRVHLQDLPEAVKESFVRALREERVVTHVPADMSGARLEETTWGVRRVENGVASLRQRSRTNEDGKRVTAIKQGSKYNESVSKLVGVSPTSKSKLQDIKGARIIAENYGVALTEHPVVIPHHNVYKRLAELRRINKAAFMVLRVGDLIRVATHKSAFRNRVWRIASAKNNKTGVALDLQLPISARSAAVTHPDNWINVKLSSLLKSGLKLLSTSYTAEEKDAE